VNGSFLFDGDESFNTFLEGLRDTLKNETALQNLRVSNDPTVVEGYKTIYDTLVNKVYAKKAGLVEILFSINSPGRIIIQAAIQTPLSMGRMYINSTSIFDHPVLDPNYFSHPAGAYLCYFLALAQSAYSSS